MILLAVRYVQNVRHPGGDDTKLLPKISAFNINGKTTHGGKKTPRVAKAFKISATPPPQRSIYSLPRGHPSTLSAHRLQRRRLVFPRGHRGRPRAGGVAAPTARAAAGDRAAFWIDRQQTTVTENPPRTA